MQGQYNMRSPAVKRLMKEAQELNQPTELYHAQPLEDNLFEWHFTLRGPEDSEFEGGIYHGRIILPPDYPMKPPSIILLTPNGRFEIFKKICLSISGHHPESWQPSWSIRTALLALIGFMPTHGGGAIGSLDYTPEERKVLAKKSQDWKCPDCGVVSHKLKPVTQASEKVSQEAKALASQINFQGEKKGNTEAKSEGQSDAASSAPATAATTTPPASATPTAVPPPGPFPFPWGVPHGWTPPNTPPNSAASGAAAFPRFPYPPSFMAPPPGMIGQTGGSQSSPQQMPMFPPPMPFFPPMYQGFPPFPRHPSSFGGGPTANTTVTAAASSGPAVSSSAAASGAATVSTAAASTGSPVSSSTTSTTTQSTARTSANTSTTSSAGTATSATASAAASSTATTTPAPSVTTTAPTSSAPSATPTELRQRQTGTTPSAAPSPRQSATPPNTQRQDSDRMSLVVMVIVAFAIGMLLARRMYIQFFSSHYRGVME